MKGGRSIWKMIPRPSASTISNSSSGGCPHGPHSIVEKTRRRFILSQRVTADLAGRPDIIRQDMSFRPSPSSRARLHALRPGQHLCLFYDRRDEQIGISLEYIRGGLHKGERCIYVSDAETLDALRTALVHASIPVDTEIARGALLLLTKDQAHLAGGRFDCESMIA